jgi:hypothetical protein
MNDMRMAGVRNWRMETEKRFGYRRILEEAKDQLTAVVPLRMVVMSVIIILRRLSAYRTKSTALPLQRPMSSV